MAEGNGDRGFSRAWGPLASLASVFAIVVSAMIMWIADIRDEMRRTRDTVVAAAEKLEDAQRVVEVQQGRQDERIGALKSAQDDFLRKYLKVDKRSQDNKDAIGRIETKMESK